MFEIGARIGDYEILDILLSSRKERVYRVRNVVADRLEALKILPESLQRDNDARERFYREIKLHARLTHPNLVTFYHAAELNGVVVMTTELVEGITLAEKLESGPMPVRKAVDILAQALSGLGHAHRQHLVHRELTPEHILLLPDGQVKLGGFGLVKQRGDMSLTAVGTALGSVDYMSPEQVKGAAEIDARADVYSAGCVLYEMLVGRKPFQAKSQFEIMACHVQRDPAPVCSLNPSIPKAIGLVISRAMSKNSADRYADADTLAAALQEALFRRDPASAPARREEERAPLLPPPTTPAAVLPVEPGWRLHLLAAALFLMVVLVLSMVMR